MRFILFFIFLTSFFSCKESSSKLTAYDVIQGKTMGTYYRVSYQGVEGVNKERINSIVDSILFIVNDEMSTYIDSSYIGKFNSNEELLEGVPIHFTTVFNTAKKVYKSSTGSFDPTIMPLVNFWGFGYSGKVAKENWDSTEVKQILDFVGFDKVSISNNKLTKEDSRMQLDFSALAKGYAVDVVAAELNDLGIQNMLVDIGGDGYAQGKNKADKNWRFGINIPDPNAGYREIFVALQIDRKGLATSGNYRNYYEVDGDLYGHTINAKTGFPFKSNVLSASIIANTGMEADALATACMASNLDEGISLIEGLPETEAYLIFEDSEGNMKEKYTSGFKAYILE